MIWIPEDEYLLILLTRGFSPNWFWDFFIFHLSTLLFPPWRKKQLRVFMTNFEAFLHVISSRINLLFIKGGKYRNLSSIGNTVINYLAIQILRLIKFIKKNLKVIQVVSTIYVFRKKILKAISIHNVNDVNQITVLGGQFECLLHHVH